MSQIIESLSRIGYEFHSYTPYKHQLSTVVDLLKYKRCYNLSGMGSGKTASSIWAYDILRFTKKVKRMMVICPLSIIESVWVKEIRNITPHLKYAIMHGPKDRRLDALNGDADIIITNHDCVRTYYKEIIKSGIEIIVIDEVTAYKHHGSARSKKMKLIADKTKAVWGLTGTPITTGAMDAYGIAKIVNPSRLPTPYMSKFRNMVMYQIDMYNYEHKPGWEKIIFDVLQPAIRFKTDECIDLPPITFETRKVKMHKDTENAYKDMVKHQLVELASGDITAINAGVKFGKLLQIASGSVINEEGEIVKLPITSKLTEIESIYYESGKKLIIFVQFVGNGLRLKEELTKRNFKTEFVYGKVPVSQRARVFEEFQTGDLEILIAQVSTASHGLTLTAASHICYFGPIMGVEKYLQSTARIRRPGQHRHQHIIKLESCRVETELFKKLETGSLSNDDILALYKNL